MAFLTTTDDYTGRTIDLEIFQTAKQPSALVALTKTVRRHNESRKVTGIQKLVQQYVLLFLSQKNGIFRDIDQGTEFLDAVNRGLIQNRSQVLTYFSFANSEVEFQLDAEDSEELPDDERLETAELLDYYIDRGITLYMKIKLTTVAGDDYTFTIPT